MTQLHVSIINISKLQLRIILVLLLMTNLLNACHSHRLACSFVLYSDHECSLSVYRFFKLIREYWIWCLCPLQFSNAHWWSELWLTNSDILHCSVSHFVKRFFTFICYILKLLFELNDFLWFILFLLFMLFGLHNTLRFI